MTDQRIQADTVITTGNINRAIIDALILEIEDLSGSVATYAIDNGGNYDERFQILREKYMTLYLKVRNKLDPQYKFKTAPMSPIPAVDTITQFIYMLRGQYGYCPDTIKTLDL